MSKTNLNPFFDAVESIPDRNHGGCLLFCYAFYLWLKKNNLDTSTFSIKEYDGPFDGGCLDTNIAFVNGKKKKAASGGHFTWMYEGVEYDSVQREIKEPAPDYMRHHTFTELEKNHLVEKFCINSLHNGCWNTEFNRPHAVKVIKDKLGIVLPKTIGTKLDEDSGVALD